MHRPLRACDSLQQQAPLCSRSARIQTFQLGKFPGAFLRGSMTVMNVVENFRVSPKIFIIDRGHDWYTLPAASCWTIHFEPFSNVTTCRSAEKQHVYVCPWLKALLSLTCAAVPPGRVQARQQRHRSLQLAPETRRAELVSCTSFRPFYHPQSPKHVCVFYLFDFVFGKQYGDAHAHATHATYSCTDRARPSIFLENKPGDHRDSRVGVTKGDIDTISALDHTPHNDCW